MATEDNKDGAEQAAPLKQKSIIDPKYRGKYKTQDWLGTLIATQTNDTKVLPATAATEATEQVGKIGEEGYKPAKPAKPAMPERTVSDGVGVDKLFELGAKNGLNLDKFQTQKGGHGFEGRFRMTVRNMLQTVAKQRHGLVGLDGSFVSAPADWLKLKSAPAEATHTEAGVKIAKAKPVEAEKPAEESKLIKTDATTATAKPAAVAKPRGK